MNIKWDAEGYKNDFGFVHQYGEEVLGLLDAPAGSFIVDLGCGNGALSQKLFDQGYRVLGVDASKEMLELAKKKHPEIAFQLADATNFQLPEKADGIFSNAVLHWIDCDLQDRLIQQIASQLKIGGQFVCEFGGKGCAETVHAALEKVFHQHHLTYRRTFYFPTIGEYAPLLEKHGLRVQYAVLFDRLTEQKTADGLADWIRMFITAPFEGIDDKTTNQIIQQTVADLKETLYHDGKWYVDYVRIRIKAQKIN